jgi:hypothetical protein
MIIQRKSQEKSTNFQKNKSLTGRQVVFPAGRQIITHATKYISALGVESIRMLFDALRSPDNVSLLITGERNNRIAHKPEHILLNDLKSFQQDSHYQSLLSD